MAKRSNAKLDSFWTFARRMLRYKRLAVLGVLFASISAGGLGAGLVALKPVLESVLDPGQAKDLPELARELNGTELIAGRIPAELIDALPSGEFTAIVWILAGLGVLTVFGAAANFLHQWCALTVVHRTVTVIRRDAFRRVIHLPLKTVVAGGATDPVSRIINDTEALAQGFTALISKALAQATKGVAAFIAALIINWQLTLAALVVAPILFTIIRKLGKRIRRASRRALRSRAGLFQVAAESVQGLRVVKVHTTERYESGRFHRINKQVLKEHLRVRTARALASPLVETLTMFVLGGLTLVAVKAIRDGHLEHTVFINTLVALGAAGASLKPLTGLLNDIQASGGAADRLAHLLAEPVEAGHDAALPKLARHARSIALDHVTVTYPGQPRPAIQDVALEIEHAETVAFVGPNGCGKTTLLSLVPRLFDPDAGRILIDGTDIAGVNMRSLRRQIGVVTQETVLFNMTVADNIAYGCPAASRGQVIEAARRARAHHFVDNLPDAYDTVVGEQGLTLSGGQRQRIAIARAILRDPAILILDEATSMIDAESESRIADAIAEFSQGRTCLVVAHRLSTVLSADRIVVMDAGRVVDQGGHDELLKRCAVYQQIARRQLVPAG